jgi:putative transposase
MIRSPLLPVLLDKQAEAALVAEIHSIHADSAGTYGSPRVTAALGRCGWRVNHKRVERLMRQHGIVGHRPRRRRGLPKADTSAAPRRTWSAG